MVGSQKLTKVNRHDSTVKTSACSVRMDLKDVKYMHLAMACHTRCSPFHHLHHWTTETDHKHAITCGHTELHHAFLRINAVRGSMHHSIAHSDTSTRMHFGRKYHRCLCNTVGRCTCDFSCLRFTA